MNIQQAAQLSELRRHQQEPPPKVPQERSAKTIAATALRSMTAAEEPYDGTAKAFQRRWLTSDSFVLMRIPIGSVSAVRSNKTAVHKAMSASADARAIIVDVNKQRLGSSFVGFMPRVVVVEGQTRHAVATLQGLGHINAWVGRKAIKHIRACKTNDMRIVSQKTDKLEVSVLATAIRADHDFGANELNQKLSIAIQDKLVPKKNKNNGSGSSIVSSGPSPWVTEVYPYENYFIYQFDGRYYKQGFAEDSGKRTVSLTGQPEEVIQKYAPISARAVPAQDRGDGKGSAQHMPMPGVKVNSEQNPGSRLPKTKVTVYSKSGTRFPDLVDKHTGGSSTTVYSGVPVSVHPSKNAPGSGVGPRIARDEDGTEIPMGKSRGGTKSELSQLQFDAVKIDRMYDKCKASMKAGKFKFTKQMQGVAPPGRESQVRTLKEKYGEDSPIPFQIAWSQHNEGK